MSFTCPKGHQSSDADYCSVCGAKLASAPSQLSPAPTKAPLPVAVAAPAPPVAPDKCPVCGTERQAGAKFCEVCRFNFETGSSQAIAPAPEVALAPAVAPDEAAALVGVLVTTPVTMDALAALNPTVASSVVTAPDMTTPEVVATPNTNGTSITPPATATPPGMSASGAPVAPAPTSEWELSVSVDGSLYTEPNAGLSLPHNAPELSFPLKAREVTIGRFNIKAPARVEVPIADPGVSGRHALLARDENDAWTLRDLGSTNGTHVNGQELAPGARATLREGDQITLGCWTRLTLRKQK